MIIDINKADCKVTVNSVEEKPSFFKRALKAVGRFVSRFVDCVKEKFGSSSATIKTVTRTLVATAILPLFVTFIGVEGGLIFLASFLFVVTFKFVFLFADFLASEISSFGSKKRV